MRSREVQQFLASITSRPLSEIDQRTRKMRELAEIPTGPRGLNAPHMDEGNALLHVMSLVSRRPSDAFAVAKNLLQNCRLIEHPVYSDLSSYFLRECDDGRLAVLMMMAMDHAFYKIGIDIVSFELFDTGELAVMNFHRRNLRNLRLVFSTNERHHALSSEEATDIYNDVERTSASNRFVIGSAHLRTLGSQIALAAPASAQQVVDSLDPAPSATITFKQ